MALEVPPPEPHLISSAGRTGSTLITVVLLVVSVLFATAGQLTLKSAMDSIGRIGTAQVNAYGDTIGRAIREPKLWIGLMLFGISAVFWLVVLSRVNLSIAYPVVGFSYIVVVAMSRWVFGEEVPTLRWIGVFIIAIGIALVGISSRTLRGG